MYAGRITYFILNRPSALGMGSDSDNCLVTEENLHKIMSEAEIARDAVDHTLCAYDYPLLPDDFACEVRRDADPSLSLTYGELFHKGTDIRHLVADRIGSRENLDGFAEPQIDLALLTVFGYD